jgi:hypothetical protein
MRRQRVCGNFEVTGGEAAKEEYNVRISLTP